MYSTIQVVEPVKCSKYTLDGNKACSVVYSQSLNKIATLKIISGTGDNVYSFEYATSEDNFDKNLPIAKHMIKSFKFG